MPLISAAGTAEENSLWQQSRCLQHTREAGLFNKRPFLSEKIPAKSFWRWGEAGEKKSNSTERTERPLCLVLLQGGEEKKKKKHQKTHTHTKHTPLFYLFEKDRFCANKDSSSLLHAAKTCRIIVVHHTWPFQLCEFLASRHTETGRRWCRESPANLKTVGVLGETSADISGKAKTRRQPHTGKQSAADPSHLRGTDNQQGRSDEAVQLRARAPDGKKTCCEGAVRGCSWLLAAQIPNG